MPDDELSSVIGRSSLAGLRAKAEAAEQLETEVDGPARADDPFSVARRRAAFVYSASRLAAIYTNAPDISGPYQHLTSAATTQLIEDVERQIGAVSGSTHYDEAVVFAAVCDIARFLWGTEQHDLFEVTA